MIWMMRFWVSPRADWVSLWIILAMPRKLRSFAARRDRLIPTIPAFLCMCTVEAWGESNLINQVTIGNPWWNWCCMILSNDLRWLLTFADCIVLQWPPKRAEANLNFILWVPAVFRPEVFKGINPVVKLSLNITGMAVRSSRYLLPSSYIFCKHFWA